MRTFEIWPTVRLWRVIIDMQPGFAQSPTADQSGTPQLRTNNVSPSGTIDLSEVKYVAITRDDYEKYSVRRGDVIFNNTNSIEWVGKTAYFDRDERFVLSNHMTRIRVDLDVLDAEFLAHYLHALWQTGAFRNRAKRWVSQAAIDQTALAQFELPLPPLSEQRRIVAILRKADELRRLRRETQREAQALLPALFEELFGEQNRHELVKLGKYAETKYGSSDKASEDFEEVGALPILRIPNIVTGRLDYDDMKYIKLPEQESNKLSLQYGDVLLVRTNGNPGYVGRAVAYVDDGKKRTFASYLIRVRLDTNEFLPEYVSDFLQSPIGRRQVTYNTKLGAGQHNLNSQAISNFDIPKPQMKLQESYARARKQLLDIEFKNATYNTEFERLYNSLLARAFSGELTAAWRERRHEQLAAEAVLRDRLLAERGAARAQTISPPSISTEAGVFPATVTTRGPRDAVLDCLSAQQREIWQAVEENDGYLSAEMISQSHDLPLARARQTLELLAAVGLLLPVALWNSEISDFVPAYRCLRSANGDGQHSDEAYADDVALLGAR